MTDLDDLRSELDDFAKPVKKGGMSAFEERVISGFEEIQRFVEEEQRLPEHGGEKNIFERIYATRLDRIRLMCHLFSENLVKGHSFNKLEKPFS